MGYITKEEVKSLVLANYEEAVEVLDKETVEVYQFLFEQVQEKRANTENNLFIFVFRSYYNMDSRSITDQFEQRFFQLMEQHNDTNKLPNITKLTHDLYHIKNKNGNPSMQFPLVTNMVNTLNPYFPTYTSDIESLFQFSTTKHLKGFYKKMDRYLTHYRYLHQVYRYLLADEDILHRLNNLNDLDIPIVKKLDLLLQKTSMIES